MAYEIHRRYEKQTYKVRETLPYHDLAKDSSLLTSGYDIRQDTLNPVLSMIRGLIVRGSINTKQHCESCGKKFDPKIVNDEGIYCQTCPGSRPTRYYINGKAFGIGHLYSDPDAGKVFKTYSDALDVLIAINKRFKECKSKGIPFKSEKFIPAKVRERHVDALFKTWLQTYEAEVAKHAKSGSRLHNLKAHQEFISGYFKGRIITDIDQNAVEKFYISLLDQRLSSRYIKDILDTLRSLFLRYQPDDVPKFPIFQVIPAREKQRLGITREIAVIDNIPERHGYRVGILTIIRTGMRINELSALKVNDLIDGTIFVDKAYSEGRLKLARKSGGTVPYRVTPEAWDMIMRHIEGKGPDEYVFSVYGQPISPARWSKEWVSAEKRAGVKHIPLQQAARHSTASRIMEDAKKKALQDISEQLGHTNTRTGSEHYIIEPSKVRGWCVATHQGDKK